MMLLMDMVDDMSSSFLSTRKKDLKSFITGYKKLKEVQKQKIKGHKSGMYISILLNVPFCNNTYNIIERVP